MAELSGNALMLQETMKELHLVCTAFFWKQLRRPRTAGGMYLRVQFDPLDYQDDLFTARGILSVHHHDASSIWYWQERQWAKIRRLRAACRVEREGGQLHHLPDSHKVHTRPTTEDDVRQIRLLVALGEKQDVVAERFRLSRTAVGEIVRRETWAKVG